MRSFTAVVLAGSLLASSAFAASSDVALAPGKPAGVSQAQQSGNSTLLIAGIAVVAAGIALVATQGNSGNNIAVTTLTSVVPPTDTSTPSTTTTTP